MSHIFISYSQKDSSYVHKLADVLEQEGFGVWIDKKIDPGADWRDVILSNLDASDGIIVVLSKNSSESKPVQEEIIRAQKANKPIYPLLLSGENFSNDWSQFEAIQYTDVRDLSYPKENFYGQLEKITLRKKGEGKLETDEVKTASWLKIWMWMFIRPDQYFYARVIDSRSTNSIVILLWLFLSGVITILSNSVFKVIDQIVNKTQITIGSLFINFIFQPPIGGIILIFAYVFLVGMIYWGTRILGGNNTYYKTFYALSIIILPYIFIEGILWSLSAIPFFDIISTIVNSILGIYFMFLQVLILKAINKFKWWWQAIGSVLIPSIILSIIYTCVIIFAGLSLRLFDGLGISP